MNCRICGSCSLAAVLEWHNGIEVSGRQRQARPVFKAHRSVRLGDKRQSRNPWNRAGNNIGSAEEAAIPYVNVMGRVVRRLGDGNKIA